MYVGDSITGFGTSQRPSRSFLNPFRMRLKFLKTFKVFLSSKMWHPSMASCPSDNSDVSFSAGSIRAGVAWILRLVQDSDWFFHYLL